MEFHPIWVGIILERDAKPRGVHVVDSLLGGAVRRIQVEEGLCGHCVVYYDTGVRVGTARDKV